VWGYNADVLNNPAIARLATINDIPLEARSFSPPRIKHLTAIETPHKPQLGVQMSKSGSSALCMSVKLMTESAAKSWAGNGNFEECGRRQGIQIGKFELRQEVYKERNPLAR